MLRMVYIPWLGLMKLFIHLLCVMRRRNEMHMISHTLWFQHLKKDFFRQDVQSSSRRHFTRLSLTVEDVVDTCERHQSQSSLHPSLLRCFSAIMRQRCVDAAEGNNSLQPEQLLRVQFVLGTLCLTSTNNQVCARPSSQASFFHLCSVVNSVQYSCSRHCNLWAAGFSFQFCCRF